MKFKWTVMLQNSKIFIQCFFSVEVYCLSDGIDVNDVRSILKRSSRRGGECSWNPLWYIAYLKIM